MPRRALHSRLPHTKRSILMTGTRFSRSLSVLAIGFVFLLMPATVFGHCDGIDGPVVKAAQQALAKGDVNPILIWVQANDEAEIRRVFAKTCLLYTSDAADE